MRAGTTRLFLVVVACTSAWTAPRPGAHAQRVAPDDDPKAVLARWNDGALVRADHHAWRAIHRVAAGPEAIREQVFVMTMASRERAATVEATTRLALEAVRQRVLLPRLQRHVLADVSVTEQELEQLRLAHPDAFVKPRRLRLRSIYKRLGEDSDALERTRSRLGELRRELENGGDFDALASAESESQSRFRGGRLGWLDPEELAPALAAAVRDLVPGELSEPVEHDGGITLFQCDEVREAEHPSPAEVRAKLRVNLERERRRQAWEAYRSELLATDPPRLNLEGETVLQLSSYQLSREDLPLLTSLQYPEASPEAIASDQLEVMLESWAFAVLATRRAEELGLNQSPNVADAIRWREADVLARARLRRRLENRLEQPSETQLRRRYESDPDHYEAPERYHLRAIHFGSLDANDARSRRTVAIALEVVKGLEEGTVDFAGAAARYSVHESARGGGDLGWLTRRQLMSWDPAASRAARATQTGEHSGLLHLQSGLWIFELLGHRAAGPATLAEAEPFVRDEIRREQIRSLEAQTRAEVLSEIGLRFEAAAIVLESAERDDEPSPRAPEPDPGRGSVGQDACGSVVVRWSTATEVERYGYDVYRGDSAEGPFERLTEDSIAGGGTTDLPRQYRYEDHSTQPGRTYYYYVEAISTNGARSRLTPIRAFESRRPCQDRSADRDDSSATVLSTPPGRMR